MRRAFPLACAAAALLATACGGYTKIGDGNAGGGAAGRGNAGSAGSSTAGSAGTATAGAGTVTECRAAEDCPQPGAPCNQCPDGSVACPTTDCLNGQCVGSFPSCANFTCNTDGDCPRSLAPCQQCADGSSACPFSRCLNRVCVSGIETCPDVDPCSGKQCGDSCSVCDGGGNCGQVSMFCDENLECQLNQPVCTTPTCRTDADCPGVGVCPPCPDPNVCAELLCVNGACQFQCGGGACSAQGESCANGETCCSGLECCSGVPVPPGQEFCGSTCPISDRNLKREFASVDPQSVLDRLAELPISTWVYETESSRERHIGPMAQDFMAAFRVGSSDTTILQVDADGVAFAAIQALYSRLQTLEQQNARLERELSQLRGQRAP